MVGERGAVATRRRVVLGSLAAAGDGVALLRLGCLGVALSLIAVLHTKRTQRSVSHPMLKCWSAQTRKATYEGYAM